MAKGTGVPEGEWKPLPDKRAVVLESDNDSDPQLYPPTLPMGKARPIARRKKPTDAKLDEADMPAMGAFGLFEGARGQCKTTAVPAVWEEQSEGETIAGSESDVVDLQQVSPILGNILAYFRRQWRLSLMSSSLLPHSNRVDITKRIRRRQACH